MKSKQQQYALLSAFLVGTHLGVVGCGGEGPTTSGSSDDPPAPPNTNEGKQQVAETSELSGEDLYKGVFFGVGPGAKVLPEIWEAPEVVGLVQQAKTDPAGFSRWLDGAAAQFRAEGKPELALRANEAAARIRETKAQTVAMYRTEALDLVAASIKDRDPTFFDRFGKELRSGNPMRVQNALSEGSKMLETARLADGSISNNDPSAWWFTVGVVLAVAYVVAFNVAAAVNMTWYWDTFAAAGAANSLQRDELIARLAERLEVAPPTSAVTAQ